MTPLKRFHSIVISTTTLLVFFLWECLTKVSIDYPFLKIPLAAIISIGIYRLILLSLEAVIKKLKFIKRWVYGRDYIEGIWAGY